MIDSHCHLNFQAFEQDVDAVIKNAKAAGVHTIINVGTQVSSSQWAVDLAQKYENLYAVIGVHPHHADKLGLVEEIPGGSKISPNPSLIKRGTKFNKDGGIGWIEELGRLAKHTKVVGIGECGLDYFSYKSNGVVDPGIQKKVFLQHLEIAQKLKLPLQIHSRTEEARKDTIGILSSCKNNLLQHPGMFHCMAGSKESLRQALDLGFFVGFDGNITYDGTPPGEPLSLAELVAFAPLDRIVVESDSPYLTPLPHRGLRNEPKYAIITAAYISGIKKVSLEKVIEQTDKNVYTVFSKLI